MVSSRAKRSKGTPPRPHLSQGRRSPVVCAGPPTTGAPLGRALRAAGRGLGPRRAPLSLRVPRRRGSHRSAGHPGPRVALAGGPARRRPRLGGSRSRAALRCAQLVWGRVLLGTRGLDEHHAARTRHLGGRGARERRGRGQGPVSMQRPSLRQAHTGRTGPRAAHHHAHGRRLSLTATLVGDGVEKVRGRRRGGRRTSAMAVRARHLHCAAPPGTSTLGAGPSTAWLSATSARRRVTRASDGAPRRSRVLGVGHYPCALATGPAPRARTTGQMGILIECPDPWRDNAAIHTPSTLASPGGRSRGRKSRSSP